MFASTKFCQSAEISISTRKNNITIQLTTSIIMVKIANRACVHAGKGRFTYRYSGKGMYLFMHPGPLSLQKSKQVSFEFNFNIGCVCKGILYGGIYEIMIKIATVMHQLVTVYLKLSYFFTSYSYF